MRKCKGKYYKNGIMVDFELGYFHQWGVEYEEFTDVGVGNYSVAIIELPNGEIVIPEANNIQFIENDENEKIEKAIQFLFDWGQTDGSHHKAWVIDQLAQILCGSSYKKYVHDYEYLDDDGNELEEKLYNWDTGIIP